MKYRRAPYVVFPLTQGLSDADFKAMMMEGACDNSSSPTSGVVGGKPGDALLTWESTLDSLMESSNGVKESLCNIMAAIKENVKHCESAHQVGGDQNVLGFMSLLLSQRLQARDEKMCR